MVITFLLTALPGLECTAQSGSHLPATMSDQQVKQAAELIDQALARTMQARAHEKGAPPEPELAAISDETFIRRIFIDLAGRLPAAEEVTALLSDKTQPAIRRLHWVNKLSGSPEAAAWRFQRMADVFRVVDEVGGVSQQPYTQWLKDSLRADMPYDRMITEMLLARGTVAGQPAAGFLLRNKDEPIRTAVEVSRNLLGADMTCAACHDHPFASYTQRQVYELASCLNRSSVNVGPGGKGSAAMLLPDPKPLVLPDNYLYRDGKPGDLVTPTLYHLDSTDEKKTHTTLKKDIPQKLADWVTRDHADRFDKVAALRIWNWMFGHPLPYFPSLTRNSNDITIQPDHLTGFNRGCEGPIREALYDQMHDVPLNREMLNTLGRVFQQCNRRMGEFQRVLAHTKAYQHAALEFAPREKIYAYRQFYTAPMIRRLPAEVIWNAMATWSGKGAEVTSQLPQSLPKDHPLLLLGRTDRQWSENSDAPVSASLTRYMINSTDTELTTRSAYWRQGSAEQQIERVFLSVLGRRPSAAEANIALEHHAQVGAPFIEDIIWATLNTSEFIFQK